MFDSRKSIASKKNHLVSLVGQVEDDLHVASFQSRATIKAVSGASIRKNLDDCTHEAKIAS